MLPHPTPQPTPASPSSVVRLPNIPRSQQNGGSMEHAANTAIAIPVQGLPPFTSIAQYQQFLLANNAGVHIPIVAAPNEMPAHRQHGPESLQVALAPTRHHPYPHPQQVDVTAIYQKAETHFRRLFEDHLAHARREIQTLKEDVGRLKRDNEVHRREAAAFKQLYEDLKAETTAGVKETANNFAKKPIKDSSPKTK
ncbi:unnamed protein product [Caenorhabditis brenneri]